MVWLRELAYRRRTHILVFSVRILNVTTRPSLLVEYGTLSNLLRHRRLMSATVLSGWGADVRGAKVLDCGEGGLSRDMS